MLLAILIATALWVYVTTVVNPGDSMNVSSVPITVNGEDVLSGKGLMIDPETNLTMTLKLLGTRNALAKVAGATSEILITIDVTGINAAGEYTLPCKITTPSTVTGGSVAVENGNNKNIRLTVTKMLSKTIDVKGSFEGTLPEGYRANDITVSPATITVQGPETIVNQISHAQVIIGGVNLTSTYTNEVGFSYIGLDDKVISDPKLASNVDTVSVILPVVKTLEVPLTVEFTDGGGATADDIEYTIFPETIQISGEENDIVPLDGKSITLGIIDLSMVTDSGKYSFPIVLASQLTNDSGMSEATVTVTVKGLSTKTLETDNIEIINAPPGYTATSVTQSLQVRVRGTEEALANIFDYQLRVVVDMKGQDFTAGQFRRPAKVYLDGGDVKAGVIGENYVVVSVY